MWALGDRPLPNSATTKLSYQKTKGIDPGSLVPIIPRKSALQSHPIRHNLGAGGIPAYPDAQNLMKIAKNLIALGMASLASIAGFGTETNPNVIMFVVDDMNDWISPLGHKQAITPNMDRLAKSGVIFKNAHAPGVFCAPSRTAIWTGLHATTTGVYDTEIFYYDYPELASIQMAFKAAGYNAYGAGKLYHHRSGYVDLRGWDEYFARSQQVKDMAYEMNSYHQDDVPLPNPFPYSPYYRETGREANRHLEWGPIDNDQEEEMAAAKRTNWITQKLSQKQDDPFFMALGLYIPHFPNYAPQKYFDLYDKEALELPDYKEDDLDDLPPAIRKQMSNRKKQHTELESLGAVKDMLQAWYASITFADALLGRVLDTLEASPHKDNTLVIFWSDQGYHKGEKGHHGKHTLWQRTSRVPFIWAGPGIAKNEAVDATVSLIDIYPTLTELCRLPVGIDRRFDGESLVSTLKDPSRAEDRDVFLPHADRGSYAVINSDWRYIQYDDGTEELYDVKADPNEWTNLLARRSLGEVAAGESEYLPITQRMQKSAPRIFAPQATSKNSLKLVVEGDTFHWEPKKD